MKSELYSTQILGREELLKGYLKALLIQVQRIKEKKRAQPICD